MFYTVRYLLCKTRQNVCINRISKEKQDQLLEANLFSTAGDQGNGKEKVERGMHSICPRRDAALGGPVAAATRASLLCALSMSQVLGNAHAAFGLGQ